MNDLIVIEELNFSYQALVLEDVNLLIQEGDFIGFIGPNGGGKTTLIKLILGLLEPQSGRVKVFGERPKSNRTRIGYVPQFVNIDKSFPITVLELVLLGSVFKTNLWGYFRSEDKKRALELLDQMGILHLAKRSFGSLSGGETQRALIAKALLPDPDILIFDEPTANVDSFQEQKILEIILRLKKKKTIILVSHDLDFVINHVDEVVLVQRKVVLKKPKDLCEHFALGLYHKPYLNFYG